MSASRETFEFGPFRLDANERLLLRESVPVALTPKVFDLLLILVRNSGHLVDKEELIREVWPDTNIEESSFTRTVSMLRKALGVQQSGQPYIETVSKAGYRFTATVSRGESHSPRSVAVLPFKEIGERSDDEYIGFGIADTLITRLSNIPEITVRPTGAVVRFGARDQDPLAAGRELAVESVVDGHLQRLGEKLRITVQFIRVADGRPLWAETFDASFTNIFDVEDAIAQHVARALELKLTGHVSDQVARRHTTDTDAYQLYEKARYLIRRFASLETAFDCLRRAVQIDPDYALAHAELGFAYYTCGAYYLEETEALEEARRSITRALELDDTLAEAQTVAAMLRFWIDWDREGPLRAYEKILASSPNCSIAYHGFGWYLTAIGRFAEASGAFRRALSLDPLSAFLSVDRGMPLYFARDYEPAITHFLDGPAMEPYFWYGYYRLGLAYGMNGQHGEAIEALEKAVKLRNNSCQAGIWNVAWAHALAGDGKKALRLIDGVTERSYEIATVYAALGSTEGAIEWLDRAFTTRDRWLSWIHVDPRFDTLRHDARFAALERRAGFAAGVPDVRPAAHSANV